MASGSYPREMSLRQHLVRELPDSISTIGLRIKGSLLSKLKMFALIRFRLRLMILTVPCRNVESRAGAAFADISNGGNEFR